MYSNDLFRHVTNNMFRVALFIHWHLIFRHVLQEVMCFTTFVTFEISKCYHFFLVEVGQTNKKTKNNSN